MANETNGGITWEADMLPLPSPGVAGAASAIVIVSAGDEPLYTDVIVQLPKDAKGVAGRAD